MGAGFSLQGWRFCSVNYKIRAIHTYRLVFYRLVFSPLKCLWNSARMMFQMIVRLTSHSHRVRITCNSFKMKKLFTYALPWCRKEQNWSTSWFSMWTQGIHRTGCHPPSPQGSLRDSSVEMHEEAAQQGHGAQMREPVTDDMTGTIWTPVRKRRNIFSHLPL